MNKTLIIDAIHRLFNGADERNWEKVQSAMTHSLWLDYSSLSGQPAKTVAAHEVIANWKAFLPAFDRTSHRLSDFAVTGSEQEAKSHFYGKADHFFNGEIWTVEGDYEAVLLNAGDAWRISSLQFKLSQQAGNTDLPAKAMEVFGKRSGETISRKITFLSGGSKLAGILRGPATGKAQQSPLIIIAPSWLNVKEQFASVYAEKLAVQGYCTLTFDFRNYGESEGTIRNYEDPGSKIEDLKHAVEFAATLPEIDIQRIYLLGICAGAGYAALAAAGNPAVKKIALVASWLHDASAVELFYGGSKGVADKLQRARLAREKFERTGEIDYVPKVSLTDTAAAMYGDFSYYLDTKRGMMEQWEADKFALMSWEPWLTFDPNPAAAAISCPVYMVHSNDAVLPDNAQKFFNAVTGIPRTLHWTSGSQFDFYDGQQVDEVIVELARFFG